MCSILLVMDVLCGISGSLSFGGDERGCLKTRLVVE